MSSTKWILILLAITIVLAAVMSLAVAHGWLK